MLTFTVSWIGQCGAYLHGISRRYPAPTVLLNVQIGVLLKVVCLLMYFFLRKNDSIYFTVITLDRFLSINFPFKVRRLDMTRTRRLMALGWLLAGFLSALPLTYIPYFQ